MGDQQAVPPHGIEVVPGHLGSRVAVGTVVVVPVLGGHEGRNAQAEDAGAGGHHAAVGLFGILRYPLIEGCHTQADPDGEHVEGAGIGIVPLPHLVRRLVQVQHDGDTRHEEHQEHNPAAALVPVKLEHQAQQPQQQRQEEVVVLALVLPQRRRCVGLVSQADAVQEGDAALPVAVEHVPGQRAVDVVLAAHEIPHEVTPIHPVKLIVKEIRQVGPEGGLAVLGAADAGALAVGVFLIEVYVTLVGIGPHAREEHLALGGVDGVGGGRCLDVLPVQGSPVGAALDLIGSPVILPVQQRRGAVLLAAQIPHQGVGVVGLIFVGGRFHAGADNHDGEKGEARHQRGYAQQHRIEEHPLLFQGGEKAPEAQHQHAHQEEEGARIVRKAEAVHEDAVEPGGQLGEVRNEQVHQQEFDDYADTEDAGQLLEGQLLVQVLAVVVHEHEGRDGKEVQQVYADAQAHQEGDEHNPAVGVGFIGLLVPPAHGPEDQGREEGRHGIHFSLHGAEPEGVGEAVRQRANGAGGEDCYRLPRPHRGSHNHPPGKEHDGEIQQEDGEGAQDGVHGIHRHGGMLRIHGNGEEAGKELEHGVSRGVAHFQFIRRRNEFPAVPEGRRGLYGGKIGKGRYHQNGQPHYPVPLLEGLLLHRFK